MRSALSLLALVSCAGGSAAPVSAPPAASTPSEAVPALPERAGGSAPKETAATLIPLACKDPSAPLCVPPPAFIERLCATPHQDVALVLFGKTPFTRLYLRGKLDELAFDEEVMALRFHGVDPNGVRVGNASGSYDVLRWDGTCSMAVDAEMLSRSRPPKPKVARVQWHRLSSAAQDKMIASSATVKAAHAKRGKECKGAMTGDVSLACERADAALVDAIVGYVRDGGALPSPEAP